jgi:hypothetical protein
MLTLLRPAFRESVSRDAYILRLVGTRFGPVLRPSYQRAPQTLQTD